MRTLGISSSFRFGRFLLQPTERRLLADGAQVPLGPKAFDLLAILVEKSGSLVTKDELLSTIWTHAVVEENSLQVQVSALRKVLGRESIATVSGRGYRFTLEVSRESDVLVAALPSAPLHNLPRSLTSFIGREKELVELSGSLRQTRLLTLTGAGGCGKTRLALQLATGVQSMFADGVWLVELASLTNAAQVPKALARTLGLKDSQTAPLVQVIAEHLEPRQVLVLLDNAEHLLDACAQLADELLKRCADVTVIVTSREALGLTGELTCRVPSLSVPRPDGNSNLESMLRFESVRLFAERARLQRPPFTVTEENAAALASICRRLDGIPLAIELAAARSRALSPAEIDRRLDERFSLLTGGSRTALPRHRTLQSLIDWSYDLLDEAEKRLLRRASVFADGWTLDAAEDICAAQPGDQTSVLDRLTSLVDKSLVMTEERLGATRYRLLETVRHYGARRLRDCEEEAVLRDRHLECFVKFAEEAAPHLKDVQPRAWLERVDAEHDNLRAALAWATVCRNTTAGLKLAVGVWRFWWLRGFIGEGREFLDSLLWVPAPEVNETVRGAALTAAGNLAFFQGDLAAARTAQEEALEIRQRSGDPTLLAASLSALGNTLHAQGEIVRCKAVREKALALYRQQGARRDVAGMLSNLGWSERDRGELDEAQRLLSESLAIRRELADTWGIATSLLNLSGVNLDRGELDVAGRLGEECLSIYRDIGERRGVAYSLGNLANIALAKSELSLARVSMRESLLILVELNDQIAASQALDGLANTYDRDDPERAAHIWGGAEGLRRTIGFSRPESELRFHGRHVASAREALGNELAFERAWNEGMSKRLPEIALYALEDPHTR